MRRNSRRPECINPPHETRQEGAPRWDITEGCAATQPAAKAAWQGTAAKAAAASAAALAVGADCIRPRLRPCDFSRRCGLTKLVPLRAQPLVHAVQLLLGHLLQGQQRLPRRALAEQGGLLRIAQVGRELDADRVQGKLMGVRAVGLLDKDLEVGVLEQGGLRRVLELWQVYDQGSELG